MMRAGFCRMARLCKRIGFAILIVANVIVLSYHRGVYPRAAMRAEAERENSGEASGKTKTTARWIDKKTFGVHQLILTGPPYERGLQAGRLTQPLLLKEECKILI